MELLIKNLSIGYEFALCENINLSLTTNNIHVLLGNNGKGKTTFLKTIAGILPPIKGSIQMDNKTKNSIAFVGTQKPHVEYLSVKEYWEFGIAKRDINLENKLINEFNIQDLCSLPIQQLSDGQFKKVSLIRQLLKKSSVLLLDEPTAYLDIENKNFLGEFLENYKNNILILLSTHDIDFAKRYGNQYYELKDKGMVKIHLLDHSA